MRSSETQFTRDNVPARRGLAPNTREVADKPIGVRFYAEDVERLNELNDCSGFIREAVHAALQK